MLCALAVRIFKRKVAKVAKIKKIISLIMNNYSENELSKIIFDSALKIHKALSPGLLESAYEECLFYELKKAGLFVEKQNFRLFTRMLN